MIHTETDFIVTDSRAAAQIYEQVFDAVILERTDLAQGLNECVLTIGNGRFHLLDENPDYQLFAPQAEITPSFWFNLTVTDIATTAAKAETAGFTTIQPLTPWPEMGIQTAMFLDPFGYIWQLHQIMNETAFAERQEALLAQIDQ